MKQLCWAVPEWDVDTDAPTVFRLGDVGFLHHTFNGSTGRYSTYRLGKRHYGCVYGQLGPGYNNLTDYADGLGRVVQIASTGRVQVVKLRLDDARAWLEQAGYQALLDHPALKGKA